ncbi:MAG: TIGR04053 family radical SAM/SPASM domain-containing protein [Candidatus Melainabacteria bacterium]|nr:TIGR04053 family radical SAM/SPASM domain-containing protein [Candidatus Melainabacteria bacterium]
MVDFSRSPFLVLWELTRACALACQHCRAKAMRQRNPEELSEIECTKLLEDLKAFGRPLLVLTGGDPIQRPDAFNIIQEACHQGFTVAMTPSATPSVTRDVIAKLKDSGLTRLAISIDGPDAETHDAFRRVAGSFTWSKSILNWAREFGLPIQINTTMCRHNLECFASIAEFVEHEQAVLWSVFFLVTVGRARPELQITADQAEALLRRMAQLTVTAPFDVKSTAAPQFRRILIEQFTNIEESTNKLTAPCKSKCDSGSSVGQAVMSKLNPKLHLGSLRSYQSVNDGKGLLFISHTGDVQPSGFLPISAGNIREESVVSIYRDNVLFKSLRDPSLLKGKCGSCRYRVVCGGSRARAYGESGDYLNQDNLCSFQDLKSNPRR